MPEAPREESTPVAEPEAAEERQGSGQAETAREHERQQEDRHFLPVILKRTDEARRHPDDILERAIEEGVEQLERPWPSLLLSAVAAGLILGFTAMSVAVVQIATEQAGPMVGRIAIAIVYPLGFVVCIMSGTELFTEHTATAVYPVLDRRSGIPALLRLWAVVWVGNLIGTAGSALLLDLADDVVEGRDGYVATGLHLVSFDAAPLLASAVLAGWLMALGGWLVLATPPAVSQVVSIYIVTFLIGLGGLHHSIAGAAEAFTAVLVGDEIGLREALRFVLWAALGNLLGGSLFVAGLNYAHIRKSREEAG